MDAGWVKLYRKLLASKVWNGADAEGKVILITLLLSASHSITQWRITASKTAMLNPGELFITYRRFAKKCGVSVKKLCTEFERLTAASVIECKSKKEGTIVRILNWEYYQAAPPTATETRLDTPSETHLETPKKPDNAKGLSTSATATETPLDTPSETRLDTHNKIIYKLNMKYNNTDLNKKQLDAVERDTTFLQAMDEYAVLKPDKANRLPPDSYYTLKVFAAIAGSQWILNAVRELRAIMLGGAQIKRPDKYMLGILQNWLNDGMPNDKKGQEQDLLDFYKKAGVADGND